MLSQLPASVVYLLVKNGTWTLDQFKNWYEAVCEENEDIGYNMHQQGEESRYQS